MIKEDDLNGIIGHLKIALTQARESRHKLKQLRKSVREAEAKIDGLRLLLWQLKENNQISEGVWKQLSNQLWVF